MEQVENESPTQKEGSAVAIGTNPTSLNDPETAQDKKAPQDTPAIVIPDDDTSSPDDDTPEASTPEEKPEDTPEAVTPEDKRVAEPNDQPVPVTPDDTPAEDHLSAPQQEDEENYSGGQDSMMHHDSSKANDSTTSSDFVRTPVARDSSLQWHAARRESTGVISPALAKHLPSPPSMRVADDEYFKNDEVVAVFNANTVEGGSMVRALARSGCQVVAIVRVFTSRNTKALLKLGKNVVVKVADSHDEAALAKAVEGADRAFLVTKYWERFDTNLEERQAYIIVNACASKNVQHLVLSSSEDTKELITKGLKSQIVPRRDGTIKPEFAGMKLLRKLAKARNVQLTHMITSYIDQVRSVSSPFCNIRSIVAQQSLLISMYLDRKCRKSHYASLWVKMATSLYSPIYPWIRGGQHCSGAVILRPFCLLL